jgi:prepilin-type N-terminal cleavage/methylation domain-containing protein
VLNRAPRDGGFTLVELAVATAVTAMILAAVVAGLRVVVASYGRVQDSGLAADRGHFVLDRFDRDLRQASSVNRPTRVGPRVYVEYETDLTDTGSPSTCTQWRFDGAAHSLDVRSWPVGATGEPGFTTALSDVVDDPATEPPFVVTPAGGGALHQQLTVTLRLALAHGQALSRATVTARNSSATSASNADADADGASDTPVCATFGRP